MREAILVALCSLLQNRRFCPTLESAVLSDFEIGGFVLPRSTEVWDKIVIHFTQFSAVWDWIVILVAKFSTLWYKILIHPTKFLTSYVILALGILGLWVFWDWLFRAWVFWGGTIRNACIVYSLNFGARFSTSLKYFFGKWNNHVVSLLMSFLRVPLSTLSFYYLVIHLGFWKAYQNCLVALIKITHVHVFLNRCLSAWHNFRKNLNRLLHFNEWFSPN